VQGETVIKSTKAIKKANKANKAIKVIKDRSIWFYGGFSGKRE
jgi:hypothetical protein